MNGSREARAHRVEVIGRVIETVEALPADRRVSLKCLHHGCKDGFVAEGCSKSYLTLFVNDTHLTSESNYIL